MTLTEVTALVSSLRGWGTAPFSGEQKAEIVRLYKIVLGKNFIPTSCQTCYHDAVIEMAIHLKRYTMAKDLNYWLRAGYIIKSPQFMGGKMFTNQNLTDEVAAAYLKQFPQAAKFFSKIPDPAPETQPVEEQPKPQPKKKKTSKKAKK